MAQINDELNVLIATRDMLKLSLEAKGQTVNTDIRTYPTAVDEISTLDVDTADANAIAGNIEEDKTAYVQGAKIIGTLPRQINITEWASQGGLDTENSKHYMRLTNTNGDLIWSNNGVIELQEQYSDLATMIHLTSNILKTGETVLGITGTYDGTTLPYGRMLDNLDNINNTQINLRQDLSAITLVGDISGYSTTSGESYPITDCKIDGHSSMAVLANQSDVASAIGLVANKIKSGVTILGITGTYAGETMKEYASETAMNNDIANIQEGEIVKVVASGTTTYYIKETTMKKLVKEEDTISPQEYEENVDLVDNILGNATVDGNELSVSGTVVGNELEVNGTVVGNELEL